MRRFIIRCSLFLMAACIFCLPASFATDIPAGPELPDRAFTARSAAAQQISNDAVSPFDKYSYTVPNDFLTLPVVMQLPAGNQAWEFQAIDAPSANPSAVDTMPIGVGPVSIGGDMLNLRVGLGAYDSPVDVYLGIYAPAIDPASFFIIHPDGSLRPYSDGLVPWKSNTRGDFTQPLYGDISTDLLPSGTYSVYLMVTPAGDLGSSHLWKTSFDVSHIVMPGSTAPPKPGDIVMAIGDLAITSVQPVQVLDMGASPALVRGKATVFRVKVKSTHSSPVDARFRLTLPSPQWDFVRNSADYWPDLSSWSWPDRWGPITINPGDNEIVLPYVPAGQESYPASITNPAGIIVGKCVKSVCGPDVRVLPKPIAPTYSYTVEVDPDSELPDINRANDIKTDGGVTYSYSGQKFLFIPTRVTGSADYYPNLSKTDAAAKSYIEYVLGMYPIPDGSISYAITPPTEEKWVFSCIPANASWPCGWTTTWNDKTTGRVDYLKGLKAMADTYTAYSADYAIGMTGGCGGGSVGAGVAAVFVGDCGGDTLAHEFNHMVTGMGDIYSLDCSVAWDNAYCEHADGTRDHCAMDSTSGWPPKPLPYCTSDADWNITCDPSNTKKKIVATCTDRKTCGDACTALCKDGSVFFGPDGRTRHYASRGFWPNKWQKIDDKTGRYIMSAFGASYSWMRMGNTMQHCLGDVYKDGYLNLMDNGKFLIGK